MASRLLALAILLIFVLVFPWWLAFILAFVLVFALEDFYEGIFPFLVFDLLYGLSASAWTSTPFLGTIFILTLLLVSDFFKARIAFFGD